MPRWFVATDARRRSFGERTATSLRFIAAPAPSAAFSRVRDTGRKVHRGATQPTHLFALSAGKHFFFGPTIVRQGKLDGNEIFMSGQLAPVVLNTTNGSKNIGGTKMLYNAQAAHLIIIYLLVKGENNSKAQRFT